MTVLFEATKLATGQTTHRAFPWNGKAVKQRIETFKKAVQEGFKKSQGLDAILTMVIDLDTGEVIYRRDPESN
jgi:hypothetical protein